MVHVDRRPHQLVLDAGKPMSADAALRVRLALRGDADAALIDAHEHWLVFERTVAKSGDHR
jgi:hypothetical protein